jgi:uncharacterized protein
MKRDTTAKIALGLLTGTAFGFLLQRGGAARHAAISRQLRFEDASVVKIMATAASVGALGTYALHALKKVDLTIKPLNTGGIVLGGTLFGTGMALLGYCPGTSMAALGEGRKDAAAGAVGMLGGALAFVRAYPHIKPAIESGQLGKRTLPEMTGTSPWLWIAGMAAAVAAGSYYLEGK